MSNNTLLENITITAKRPFEQYVLYNGGKYDLFFEGKTARDCGKAVLENSDWYNDMPENKRRFIDIESHTECLIIESGWKLFHYNGRYAIYIEYESDDDDVDESEFIDITDADNDDVSTTDDDDAKPEGKSIETVK